MLKRAARPLGGSSFGAWCDLVLNAWHAVEVEEDMSAIPEIFDLPCANVVNLHIPRVALTIHTDASSAGQFRDEDPSCLVLNISKLRYTREWDPPCVTCVRQTIKVGEVSIWDFGRSVGSKCRGKQEQEDGLCVLLISASEAAGEAGRSVTGYNKSGTTNSNSGSGTYNMRGRS